MASKENKLGALWQKTNALGQPYYSGTLTMNGETIKIVVFKNRFKERDAQPDYQIFLSEPQAQTNAPKPTQEDGEVTLEHIFDSLDPQ